jgi:hypothetical protein
LEILKCVNWIDFARRAPIGEFSDIDPPLGSLEDFGIRVRKTNPLESPALPLNFTVIQQRQRDVYMGVFEAANMSRGWLFGAGECA